MNLDIPTLALVQSLIMLVEVFILWFQIHRHEDCLYVKLWITGTTLMALGVFFMPLVKIPSMFYLAVISNPLYILGLLIIYQGTVFFLQNRFRIRLSVILYTVYVTTHFYFIFQHEIMWIRHFMLNITLAIIFLLISEILIRNKNQTNSVSFIYTAVIFSLAAVFSIIRIVLSLNKPSDVDFKGLGITLPLYFLFFALLSILWTFGLILIHYDRVSPPDIKPEEVSEKEFSDWNRTLKVRNPYALSDRELEIAAFLSKGLTYEEIARDCYISKNTVKTHIKRIYNKYNVNSRVNFLIKMKEDSPLNT